MTGDAGTIQRRQQKLPPINRADADYLIAEHIATKGVTRCKAGVAIGGGSAQFSVDPSTMAQIPVYDKPLPYQPHAKAAEIRRRAMEQLERNSTKNVRLDVTVPEKPAMPQKIEVPAPPLSKTARPAPIILPAPEPKREHHRRKGPMRRFTEHGPLGKPLVLDREHDAVLGARTYFPSTVRPAAQELQLLKSGEHSRKIGSHVVKGAWDGMPIFTLTLEERATCPRSCVHWRDCYGNHMHFAVRIRPDETFERKLERELRAFNFMHRGGFVVRLHILGDFFSPIYVDLWRRALADLSALRVFGYTARRPDDEIGAAIAGLNRAFPDRCMIRFSNHTGDAPEPKTRSIDRPDQAGAAVICPAQTEKTACCGTCALCWSSSKTIAFMRH